MITLRNVSKAFGAQRAVDGVSFEAGRGITGFLGPNGAGKSTTMRMITGYLEPTAGEIEIEGERAFPSTPAARRRVGYLPEHNPLYVDMYVREYLAFAARAQGADASAARIAEVIDTVGLGREAHKRIRQLSKGYRQRVGFAQALLHDPPVLILDEPTNGFDPNQLAEIREVIRRLGERKTVLLSTHVMQEVQALCERVLIIDRGRLVADDPIERLGTRLAGSGTVRITCQRPPAAAPLLALPGVVSVDLEGPSARLTVLPQGEVRPAIAEVCSAQGWGLLELRREAASVEEAFRALTREAAQA